ncbi:glycosyltransferase [Pyxidicoccus parkwayensis]|uniref:Glycosyltransferase n=1 Tax=Pyxidicoccus parkwayensis TaxID=2813578 RepID=A0ABX7P3Q5_9BACT|nr:glycosyltransferase [Pyxidicoccus parkwaysis]QSQ25082.1 glycosyltransferase [Pyxidicoccus parkwaysis]
MRICLVSKSLAPFTGGDLGEYASRMARALADAGHEVHVLTAPQPGLTVPAAPELPGVHLHLVEPLPPALGGAFPHPPIRHAMQVYEALRALHASHAFDVIEFPERECEGVFAIRAKRTLGHFASVVLAVRLHTPTADLQQLNCVAALTLDTAQQEFFEAASIREADLLLSPTRALLERVTQRLGLGDTGTVAPRTRALLERVTQRPGLGDTGAVVPPPFARALPPVSSAPPSTPPRVLYAGPLEYRKGLHVLIAAMQSLFEKGLRAEVWLLGDDTPTGPGGRSLRQWLERSILPAWKHCFHFEPRPTESQLAQAFASATVCCLPSLWDNLPHELLEAMAAGCPVVASDAGGMAELIEDGRSGRLFRSGDVAHLASVLEQTLGTPALKDSARVASLCAPNHVVKQFEAAVARAAASQPAKSAAQRTRSPGTPRVSFLVPYFNMGRYLPETLRSIRAQSFTDYEIVLVDDGSTDAESLALLDTLQAPDLRIVRKPNGGLSSARNAGLQVARGHYVLPLDPDDLIEPTFLEKAVAVMEGTPGLAYVTSLVAYFRESPDNLVGGWVPSGMDRDALWVVNVASTCTALMERTLLLELGGYDEWLTSYEDWDVFSRMAERGMTGTVIPEFLFLYRLRHDSMTHTLRLNERQQMLAWLSQKHPALALDAGRALRIQQGEAHRLEARLLGEIQAAMPQPLLNRVADRVNGTLKRFDFLHHTLKRAARVVAPDESRPIRHQIMDRFLRRGGK